MLAPAGGFVSFAIMEFYDPRAEVDKTRHKLPHWQQGECAIAVTFRLADSLPKEKLDAWRCERDLWLLDHPKPWTPDEEAEFHQRFAHRVQKWLDAGHGSCVLRAPQVARLVAAVLHAREDTSHVLWAWVVMPNHVHVLASLLHGATLPAVLKQWKGVSALAVNRALGSAGRLWQPDYFDRLVRSRPHFVMCLNYIRDNPVKAKLREGEFLWWERPGVREILDRESMEQGMERGLQSAKDEPDDTNAAD